MSTMTNAELDVAVATEVMGYSWGPPADSEGDRECWRVPREDDPLRLADLGGAFHPSTSIVAAWAVVEKFTDVTIEKAGNGYEVAVNGFAMARSSTAPRAICIASLIAVGKGAKK